MTNTPDTDANQIFLGLNPDEGDYFVPAEIARQLEQQRNEVRNQRDAAFERYNEAVELYNAAVIGAKLIDKDLKKAESERDKLAEELDALKRSILDLSHPNMKLLLEERDKAVNNYETAVLREHRMEEQRDWYKAACDKYSEDETINTLRSLKEQRDRLAEALWSMLNQDDMSAIRAGILLRSLGLQSPTNPNEL